VQENIAVTTIVNQAHSANNSGDFSLAKSLALKAIKINKNMAESWFNLGLAEIGLHNKDPARKALKKSMTLASQSTDALNAIGQTFYEMREYELAKEALSRAIRIDASNFRAHSNLSLLHEDLGNEQQAIAHALIAKDLNPKSPAVLCNSASVLKKFGQKEKARELYEISLSIQPNFVPSLVNLANLFLDDERFLTAKNIYKKIITLDPKNLEGLCGLGITQLRMNLPLKAEQTLHRAYSIDNKNSCSLIHLATAKIQLGKKNEAHAILDAAATNNIPDAFSLIGRLMYENNSPELAIEFIEKSKKKQIDSDTAMSLANAYSYLDNNQEAEKNYKYSLNLDPDNHNAATSFGFFLLSHGKFKEAEKYHNKRTRQTPPVNVGWLKKVPQFNNEAPKGSRILIHGEQGVGDEILHFRFALALQNAGYAVTLSADERLFPVFRKYSKNIQLITKDLAKKLSKFDFDYQEKLASLMHHFLSGNANISQFRYENNKPRALENKNNQTNHHLDPRYVGISWGSANKNNQQAKSVPLEYFSDINLSNHTLLSLQYGDTTNQIKEFNKKYRRQIKVTSNIDITNDFVSLLEIISDCEFVISASNVTVHLAGLIDKKTYLLLPKARGRIWYWNNRDANNQSLWYPSVKIIQQQEVDNWTAPIEELNTILGKYN